MILTAGMADSIWTAADRDAIKAAVLDLATGKRTVTVSYAGPPARSVTYGIADLPALEALLAKVNAAVTGGATYRLGATRKGLGA